MEWSDVRIFLAVMRSGSYGEAARRLGVSHPTVGRRIKVLEAQAHQALFRRTPDGLVLTDAGDAVLGLAESMENAALAMERRLTGNHPRLEGILRISCAEWFATTPQPPPSRDIWVGYHQDLRHMDRLRAMLDIADAMLVAM
ncbi:hypothetical protein E05_27960 [Plautia stali symbiont]|nr:hypothetical protein E05_27960 [Plautia stali symbiont]